MDPLTPLDLLKKKSEFDATIHKLGLDDLASDCNIVVKSHIDIILDQFLTTDAELLELKGRIRKLAPHNIPILILGETGTGKELIANALHGNRPAKSFVSVNCGAIPSELLESEFFGNTKGAFTGATSERKGLIHQANGGTLFLDEIGDMPYFLQCKLLRVLEYKTYRRVGELIETPANFRLVTATNILELNNPINKDRFRLDLYYRIAGHVIRLKPLRERPLEDRALICQLRCRTPQLAETLFNKVKSLPLLGNVRELLNLVEEHNILHGE